MQRSAVLLLILIGFFFSSLLFLLMPPLFCLREIYLKSKAIKCYFSSRRVGQLNMKWCHCLHTPSTEDLQYAPCARPDHAEKKTPSPSTVNPHAPSVSCSATYMQVHLLNNKATAVQISDKIVLLSKMDAPQNFCSKCTNTKACGLSSIAFMSLPLPSL